ncbi:MAG: hypothetical protein ABIA37_02875 [Candidatus Woesearchaeota archaeon]
MTTILGIKSNLGEESIVLASDTQLNLYDGKNHTGKEKISKLRAGRSHLLAFSGNFDKYLESFFSYLTGRRSYESFVRFVSGIKKDAARSSLPAFLGNVPKEVAKHLRDITQNKKTQSESEKVFFGYLKEKTLPSTELEKYLTSFLEAVMQVKEDPVEEAVRTGYFKELAFLNRFYTKRAMEEEEETVELILASNKPALELYHVDHFGNLIEVMPSGDLEYLCLGSGSEHVNKYIDEAGYEQDLDIPELIVDEIKIPGEISPDRISTKISKCLAYGAITEAIKKDPNTGGFVDLAVITKEKIKHYGPVIQTELGDAVKKVYLNIIHSDTEPEN